MFKLTEVPQDIDLAPFGRWLDTQGVVYRITEEGNSQVIWLVEESWREPVLRALEKYRQSPELRERMSEVPPQRQAAVRYRQAGPRQAPLTLAFVIAALVLTWMTGFGRHPLVQQFFFVDPSAWPLATPYDRWLALVGTLSAGQWWRLFTPDFLHFSVTHIAFDAVLFWFLGNQIEVRDGKWTLVALFIASSLMGNTAQYFLTGPEFGGLSGVVYAMLGYCWISQMRLPRFHFPPALIIVSVAWMLLGLTPFPEMLGVGRMANGAHAGGFLSGLILALLIPPRASVSSIY